MASGRRRGPRRAWATWRAVRPTKSIAATSTVLSRSTRPCGSPNSDPPSRRYSCISPLTTVTTIAGPEMRLKPRTAWTRSSSPGPASTTRASSTTPPTHTAIARAWEMPATTPRMARSPPVRDRPSVMTANVGMAMAGSWVVGSMTRSGRNTTQTQATTSTTRATAARPAQPASRRSSHPTGLRPLPNDSPFTAAVSATTYSNVPTQRQQPHRTQEPHGEDVLRALRPRRHDQHQRPEQHRQPERRQRPAQPGAPSETSEASTTTSSVDVAVSSCLRRGAGLRRGPSRGRRRDRRREDLEAEPPGRPGVTGRLADGPRHVARAGRHRLEDVDRQRQVVVAARRGAGCGSVNGLLLQATVIWLALPTSPLNVRTSWLARLVELGPVRRLALHERGRLGAGRPTAQERHPDERGQDRDDEPQRSAGNTGSGGHPLNRTCWPCSPEDSPDRDPAWAGRARAPGPRDTPR